MTVNQLHRILGAMIAAGHGRRRVCVDKPSFAHNLESDGCVILDVDKARIETYRRIDDDGGTALRADGTERMITSVVLTGDGTPSIPTQLGKT